MPKGLTSQLTNSVTISPFGLARNAANGAEVHLEHHRVNHQPQQHPDRHIHLRALAELQSAQRGGHPRQRLAQRHPCHHAQEHPYRQVPLEERQTLRRLSTRLADCTESLSFMR